MTDYNNLFNSQLNNFFNQTKKRGIYYSNGISRQNDIQMLLRSAMKEESLTYKILLKKYFVQAKKGSSFSQTMRFMNKKSMKGMIVRWQDKNGNVFYLLNYGRDKNGRNKIRILQNGDLRRIQKMHKDFLRRQMKKQISRIYQRRYMLQIKRSRKSMQNFSLKPPKEKPKIFATAGTFEKVFMETVKNNKSTSIAELSENILDSMGNQQKQMFANRLVCKGIKTNRDYMDYLCSLRKKALEVTLEKSISKDRSLGRGRGI